MQFATDTYPHNEREKQRPKIIFLCSICKNGEGRRKLFLLELIISGFFYFLFYLLFVLYWVCIFKFKTTTNVKTKIIYHSQLKMFLESFYFEYFFQFMALKDILFSGLKIILRVESNLLISLLFCLNSLVPRNKKNAYAKWTFKVFSGMFVRNKMQFHLKF